MFRFSKKAKNLVETILQAVFPENIYCMACGNMIDSSNKSGLCKACREKLLLAGGNACKICGRIFEEKMPDNLICAGCLRNGRGFEKAVGVCAYNDISKKIIGNFKTRKKLSFAKNISRYMANNIASKLPLAEIDFVVPIPLTKRKLQKRGFNQSGLLANYLGALLNIPIAKNLLVKMKETPDTKKLSEENRLTVLGDAFAINDSRGTLAGKTALVVDDVFTTGTTAEVSASVLKGAGCEKIYFASFTTRMARTD